MKLTVKNSITVVYVIAIAATCIVSHVSADPMRYKVTGKVDPVTGYRIEYTVGSRFQQEDMHKRIKGGDQHYFEFVRFRPANDPAAVIGTKDGAGEKTSKSGRNKPLSLSFSEATLTSGFMKGAEVDKLGYVTVDNSHGQYGKAVYQQRVTVGGYPATWSAFENKSDLTPGSTQRYYLLLLKLPSKSRVYEFIGVADGKQEQDDAQTELTAIRDSIRLVKAK